LALAALLTSCAPISRGIDYCAVAAPILISKQDVLTDGTAKQILGHNRFWQKECD
jgi:hypothetical protein